MACISPYDALPSKYDLWNGYSNLEHLAQEASDPYDDLPFRDPIPSSKALRCATSRQLYHIRVTDDETMHKLWLVKTWTCGPGTKNQAWPGYIFFRYTGPELNDGDDSPFQWVFPVSTIDAKLSDAATIETAKQLDEASPTMFGLACYLVKHNYPDPADLPLFISARNWRYRRIKLGDHADRAIRIIQDRVRKQLPIWRDRRALVESLLASTPFLADSLKPIVSSYYEKKAL